MAEKNLGKWWEDIRLGKKTGYKGSKWAFYGKPGKIPWFLLNTARKPQYDNKNWEQRSIAKVSYAKNIYPGQWRVQGKYLARQAAQLENTPGLGFDGHADDLDIPKVLNVWQESGDPRIWKVIISPEMAHKLDLKEHVRAVMGHVEKDLSARLEWVAIGHYDTDNPHAHIVIRGIDREGQEVRMTREYFTKGFRLRSQQEATRVLGFRLKEDILLVREKQIKSLHITELDREIESKLNESHFITLSSGPKSAFAYEKELQLKGRLMFLEGLGQAKRDSSVSWYVEPGFLECLKYIQTKNDIIKSRRAQDLSNEQIKSLEELARQLKPKGPSLHLSLIKEVTDHDRPGTN